ncbi:WG repeat-containing protein [Paenibacillus albus]|uniref:WG repeat-containing protein n=1 Tax=Paenibacillus albus TaxID=2495582 RepID=A0A3Q8X706_9BACL|nr:WG repeat-containing protein [Paenibacillus albus]AZN41916.1 WG repeat-containing protein [Paenibacillus albus]
MFNRARIVVLSVMIGSVIAASHAVPQEKAAAAAQTVTAEASNKQLYPVQSNGKYGFMNSEGKLVLPIGFAGYSYSGRPGDPIMVDDAASRSQIYYNSAGKKLFECQPNECGTFNDGMAIIAAKTQDEAGKTVNRYGYINTEGKVVIPPIYANGYQFVEGIARVSMGKASGFINKQGQLVTPLQYSQTMDFSEGLAVIRYAVNGKYGYIDTSGKIAIPPSFSGYASSSASFSDGAAVVYEDGKYGYIDRKGKYLLKPQFSMAQPFSEGLAFVERNGVTFYINKQGKKVIQNIKAGGLFRGGLAPASPGQRYGYIDRTGKFAIKPTMEWAEPFSGDLAKVILTSEDDRKTPIVYAYVNRKGKIVWVDQSTN